MAVRESIATNLSNQEQAYLARAVTLAKLSTMRQKHGAIIVKSGRILSMGFNTSRNESISNYPASSYSNHAESMAIRMVPNSEILVGSKLFVARVSRRGNLAYSRPCDICMESIVRVGIKSIVYTTT